MVTEVVLRTVMELEFLVIILLTLARWGKCKSIGTIRLNLFKIFFWWCICWCPCYLNDFSANNYFVDKSSIINILLPIKSWMICNIIRPYQGGEGWGWKRAHIYWTFHGGRRRCSMPRKSSSKLAQKLAGHFRICSISSWMFLL